MATTKQNSMPSTAHFPSSKQHEGGSIVDDFMYGSNVASAHIYIRMGFMRKVYGILSAQLLVTTLVAAVFMTHEVVVVVGVGGGGEVVIVVVVVVVVIVVVVVVVVVATAAALSMRTSRAIAAAVVVPVVAKECQLCHWMMTVSLFGTLGILFALMWKRHETPTNYILLGAFTLMEAYSIGVIGEPIIMFCNPPVMCCNSYEDSFRNNRKMPIAQQPVELF
ncbi:transmembrane BAX inhibitor motif-containing protein 4 [Elysia marginata]|uniref:Transmembrane BAX inhibitor motif-containing protein 4 n=1 Tax=Elysia marginata TaxID=1093978 RepID=A0AAV4HQ39_9GAST|nr:transmembrane BAX inhibitor motif-containing protein 4 [Elysia marginata]